MTGVHQHAWLMLTFENHTNHGEGSYMVGYGRLEIFFFTFPFYLGSREARDTTRWSKGTCYQA